LVAISIMLVLMALFMPAMGSLKGAGDVTKAAYDIKGIFDQARGYAMANNTFVFVGIAEVDSSKEASANPQVEGTGRIAVAVVASKDGTRGYDAASGSLPNPAWSNLNLGANLVAISKLQRFENLHLAPLFSTIPNSGGTTRPSVSSGNYQIGNTACASVTPFDWPIGSAIGSGQYSFQKVINFDPQGVARIQTSVNTDTIAQYMEIGLQQSRGTTVSPNVAAIQIDGMSGTTRIYRP
jgi:type II secretory pathway pseudopilin PulG